MSTNTEESNTARCSHCAEEEAIRAAFFERYFTVSHINECSHSQSGD